MNKNMKKVIVCAVAMLAIQMLKGVDDLTIAEHLIASGLVIDASGGAKEERQLAESLCEYDTNRLARIVASLSKTNDLMVAAYMNRLLGRYGDASHLPTLYENATNANLLVSAATAILRIEGITSNSVVVLGRCLGVNTKDWRQMDLCRRAIARFRAQLPSAALSNEFTNCLLSSALSNNVSAVAFDENLKHFDPSYAMSTRRLRVLRSVQSMGLNATQSAYVTNAINELVAYPEANLPE